jgi:ribosomal protein S18 acetylase RimI-like enzyme
MIRIDRLEAPTPADREAILAPLDEFSRSRGFVWRPELLTLALRDDEGRIVGGLMGETHWEWLHVSVLSVAEGLRGRGWGRSLMLESERIARDRGCHHAWLDTFSFQARPFYESLGYRVFGTLPDYPRGQARFFLAKALGDEAPSA